MEQIFLLGGRLSDPNMNPSYLGTLVYIGSNEKAYMPPTKHIWQLYLRKFSQNGKLLEDAPAYLGLVEVKQQEEEAS